MHPFPGDSSLYVNGEGEKIDGISGQYVDDSLNARNKSFEINTEQTLSLFESKPHVYDNFEFFGTRIRTTELGEFFVGQQYYVNSLTYASENSSFEDFPFISCPVFVGWT